MASEIEPSELRKEVAASQIDGVMTDMLAVYLMRIHDIVKKKTEAFRVLPEQELEEMVSWSLERWVKGFKHIDLSKYANPFSYFYKGTYLNMLNRLM